MLILNMGISHLHSGVNSKQRLQLVRVSIFLFAFALDHSSAIISSYYCRPPATALTSRHFYSRQFFHQLGYEITDLDAAAVARADDARNPCPWPQYPHVAGRFCERRCDQLSKFHDNALWWCEAVEEGAELEGIVPSYNCICPRSLARHANGTCVPSIQCPEGADLPKCHGDREVPRCGNACPDISCTNLTLSLGDPRNTSECLEVCKEDIFTCSCQLGLVRHNGRCVAPHNCPRENFTVCGANEQLDFHVRSERRSSCNERTCAGGNDNAYGQEFVFIDSCYQSEGNFSMWPTCWWPHYRLSNGACVMLEQCQTEQEFEERMKAFLEDQEWPNQTLDINLYMNRRYESFKWFSPDLEREESDT